MPAANGQVAVRIIKDLLKAGCKVTAGVTDVEEAGVLVDVAKKLELLPGAAAKGLRLVEVDPQDPQSVQAAIPKRGARVVVVCGDTPPSGRKENPRATERLLQALLAQDEEEEEGGAGAVVLAQLMLVSVQRGGVGTRGFALGSLGSRGKSAPKLGRAEQMVTESGVEFVILRTANTDNVDDSFGEEAGVILGTYGNLDSAFSISKSQVGAVATQLLLQAPGSCVVEAAADPETEVVDVARVVAEMLPATILQQEEEDEEEEEEAPKAALGGFGIRMPTFGTQKIKAEEVDVEIADEEGEYYEEEEAPPATKARSGFGFGTMKLPKIGAKRAAKVEEAEEEEQEQEAAAAPAAPRARGGRSTPQAPARQQVRALAASSASVASEAAAPGGAPGKQSGGGLLAAFGFGQKAVYVDELD